MALSGNYSKTPKAFIFDLDGTLLDTEPLYTIATQKLLDPYGAQFTMALKRQCMGGDSRRSARIVIDHFSLPIDETEYLASREVHLRDLFPNAPSMPGAEQFLRSLSQAQVPIGLATSSHQHLMELKFSRRDWGDLFDEVVCGDDAELVNGKPAPDIFILCADRLGIDPSECLAFEDSPNGVQAACAAGMSVVGINSQYVADGGLSDADIVIDDYADLGHLIDRWTSK